MKNGGDLVIKVLGSGQGPSSREENVDLSQESEWPPSAVLYANACIVCQRVPYVAAAVRFASQKLDQRLLSSTKSSSEAAPFATLFLSGEECSAAGVRAVLEWAYTGAFAARDWRQLAEVLRAGSYLGVTEVVQLSQEALLRLAAPVGRELERVGRSQAVRGLWESVSGALVSDWDLATGRLNPLHSKLNERLSVEKDGVPLFVRNQAKKRYIEDQDSKNASSFSTDRASLGGSAGFPKEAADFVVEGLTVLSSCGEEGTASRFLESACPSLESVLLMLLHLDLRIVSSVLGMLLERLDHLRGSAGQRTGSNEVPLNDLSGEGKLDAGVLVVLHRWWGVNPSERLALARALLGEHVCLGALGISTLEELIAQCRKAAVEGLGGAKNSKASSLLRLEELEGAYRFALRTDNEYGRSKRLMRQTVAHWKCLDQSKAWRSWHEFCRDGLGTTRLVLAKRAMRVGCLRSSARYFAAWRQAAVEGRVAERQRLALWKWQRACQKLLNAKQGVSLS